MVKSGVDDVSLNDNDKEYIANQIEIGSLKTVSLLKEIIQEDEKKRFKEQVDLIRKSEFTNHLMTLPNIRAIAFISAITSFCVIVIIRVSGIGNIINFILPKL